MKAAPIPTNEEARLRALLEYQILDSTPEISFDDLTRLASFICGTPMAIITLVDKDRQWFKSIIGLDAQETPRDISFCGHVIHDETFMTVEDALQDPRFHDNPLVTSGPNIRFYAGAPLKSPSGHSIGTLCVADSKPRKMTNEQTVALEALARQVVCLFELRRQTKQLKESNAEIKRFAETVAEQKQQMFFTSKMAALGRISTSLAHEINNPLAIVLGRLERLLEAAKSGTLTHETAAVVLEKTISNAHRITAIIKGLRAFARDGANDPMEDVNVLGSIQDLQALFGARIKKDLIHFDFNCAPDLSVWGRPVQLSQIIFNLATNSADAIQSLDEKWIRIETKVEDEFVEIRVIDSGTGIAPEIQDKVMEPFFTTKPSGSGTGLGLSISQGLAASMGGKLFLDPSAKNTTFVLQLKRESASLKKSA